MLLVTINKHEAGLFMPDACLKILEYVQADAVETLD